MRALVTGAGGFCGRNLVRYLERQSVEVHTLSPRAAAGLAHHRADPGDPGGITAALRAARPDYILHLAGVSHAEDIATYYRVNTLYAANLIGAAEAAGLGDRPMLIVGSAAEYGPVEASELPVTEAVRPRPLSHYGVSKLAQTLMAETVARHGRPLVIVRPANIIGPGMAEHNAVQSFARQIAEIVTGRRPPVMDVGNLDTVRDFVDVEDVVAIYWRLIREPAAHGEVVNVGTGTGTRVGDLLSSLIRIAGIPVDVRRDPARLKEVDVPVHFGSVTKLARLLDPLAFTPLDVTLETLHRSVLENL